VSCATSGTTDVVNAIVITTDPGDLTRIANAIGVKIRLYPT
jgi:hypothetical protein